jgi:hypothetical protein
MVRIGALCLALAVAPVASAAELAADDQKVLREGLRVKTEASQRGVGEGYMAAADKGWLDHARARARQLAAEGSHDTIAFLAEIEAQDLLVAFRDAWRLGTTPQLEALVLKYHAAPKVGPQHVGQGPQLADMLGRHNSRPIFDALLADVHEGKLPYLYAHLRALARTDLPGVEPELLSLLGDSTGVNFPVARLLLFERRYSGAAPRVIALLQTAPDGQAAELAQMGTLLENEEVVAAIAARLAVQARKPTARGRSEVVEGLGQALEHMVPWVRVPLAPFSAEALAAMQPAPREQVAAMLQRRTEVEARYRDRTYANFVYWVRRYPAVALRFIEEGFDARATGPEGTPMQLAMEHSNALLVAPLLRAGADPNTRRSNGVPLLHHLAALAARDEDAAVAAAALAIDQGALVSARDSRQTTALHQAVIAGAPKMAALLLDRGADVNAEALTDRNVPGLTPVQLALDMNNEKLAALLRARGGAVNERFVSARARESGSRSLREAAMMLFAVPWIFLAGAQH